MPEPFSAWKTDKTKPYLSRHYFTLSGGRDWAFPNRDVQINEQLQQLLASDEPYDAMRAASFLKRYRISTLVLEDGDKPGPTLLRMAYPVFRHGDVRVFLVSVGSG